MPKRTAEGSIKLDMRFRPDETAYSMLKACGNFESRSRLLRWHLAWAIEQGDSLKRRSLVGIPAGLPDPQTNGVKDKPIRIRLSLSPGEPGYSHLISLPHDGDSRTVFFKRYIHYSLMAHKEKLANPQNVQGDLEARNVSTSPDLDISPAGQPNLEGSPTPSPVTGGTRRSPRALGAVLD